MKKEAGSSFDLWGIFLQSYLLTFLQKQRVRTKTPYCDHYTIEWSLYILSIWLELIIVPDVSCYQS